MKSVNIGFLGAGGIARAHLYALQSMRFYYNQVPDIHLVSVCSAREESRKAFAAEFGFAKAVNLEDFTADSQIDTVFILGPNNTHAPHFKAAMQMEGVRRIYLEKPVCSSEAEEKEMAALMVSSDKTVQVGFQYLQTPSVREALTLWKSGILGKPLHFDLKYYHGDYLHKSYRDKRATRLTPAPDGGAMADLGSHGISLLTAFLGNGLQITGAIQAGNYEGVPEGSDLFSSISLVEPTSQAAGHLSASRITSGSGDLVYLEIFAEKGALRYSSQTPDYFEYFIEKENKWVRQPVGSNYPGISSFPSGHVPAGWLRSMVHAHWLFLTGSGILPNPDKEPDFPKSGRSRILPNPDSELNSDFIPGLAHGLEVQRLVRETAHHLEIYRKKLHHE